ncbi:cell growth regulator with RING finger domain protein 1 isoform X2 [Halyomorpha halys]|nr:cell growth regulator with RING finger domain protein 1-like isoform X2 [Halyomorpha halys]
MKMMEVHIPFTFKIQQTQVVDNEIHCLVSSQDNYKFMAFWAVSVHELHMLLWLPWTTMSKSIEEGSFLQGYYVMKGPHLRNANHEEKVFKIRVPSENSTDFKAAPKLCYPLVVFLVTDCEETPKPEEAVALISILHVNDSICQLPTSIISQYLKQANGQVSRLKQLYLASDDPENVNLENDLNFVEREKSKQLCVVCLNLPLSRALLPCRHTCVCGSCFDRLKSCPLCRSPIRSYFCIRSEDYLADLYSSDNKSTFQKVQEFISELLEGEEWLP